MILGRVLGEVWAARKHAALEGHKLLLVRPHLWYAPAHESGHLIAVDTVGAGVGDDVIVCLGTPARQSVGSLDLPLDAAVSAIVDRVELGEDLGPRTLTFVDGGKGPRGMLSPVARERSL